LKGYSAALYAEENRVQKEKNEEQYREERLAMIADMVGEKGKFLKVNSEVEALIFDEKIIGLKLPIKVDLKVTEAHPAVKGDTAKGGTKQVVLETGATINAPMFVKEGDILRINTETGEYTDRLGSNF
jgi:elongation factor P